ncbi:MAG: hypothetical protein KBT21_06125 [Treponema sp.]|nr:hypothetical protein [Candidatus Treponema merdequi]
MKLFKKTEKFFTSLLVFFTLGNFPAFAEDYLAEARKSGKIYHRLEAVKNRNQKEDDAYLIPQTEFSEDVVKYVFGNSEKAGFAAESLYYVKKSDLISNSKSDDKKNIDTSISAVSKIMRSVSKMKGMEYYSNTRKRFDTLYLESYRIENPDSTTPVDDLLEGSSDGKVIYAFQEEHSFGKGIYKISYNENSRMVVMKMENLTTLSYGFIKAVKPEKCKVCVNVIDDGDGYFVWIGMNADFMQMSILEKKMNKSFMARLDAIFKWITIQF